MTRGQAFMLLAVLLWPMLEFSGVSLMPRHHALQVVFLRYAAHLLVLAAVLLPRRGVRDLRTQRPVLQLLRGVMMFGMPASYVLASNYSGNRWIWSMFWLVPLGALVAAAVLLRERPRWFEWAAAFLGALGAVLISGGRPSHFLGTLIAMAMGGSIAGYLALSRMLRDESLATSLIYTALGAILPTSLLVWKVWTPIVAADVLPTLVVGVLSVAILGAMDRAVEIDAVATTTPLLALVPVLELGVLSALGRGAPGRADAVGVATVLLGVTLLLVGRRAGRDATPDRTVAA